MSETDPFAGQWRDLTSVLPATDPQPETTDKHIQRIRARAAEKRTNRHDAIQAWAEKRDAHREDRRAARTEARELRAEKRADRTARAQHTKTRIATTARSLLITGPILAPMAVAWTGQSQFATQILGWVFIASVLYAAAYELTTAYWAWLYHQARSDGDSGWEYRLATWVFATGAAIQQWWHYSDHWHATPRAVTYSVMSGVGVLLWEGYARLIHRRKLRAEGKLAPARPRIGLARWIRYPVRSWTAWSLITLEGHRTLDAAWTAADALLRSKSADCAERTAARETVRLDRTGRTGRRLFGRTAGPDRTSLPPTARAERTALPARTTGPDRTATVNARVDLTKADRTAKTSGPDRTAAATTGSDRPDRKRTATRLDRTAAEPGTRPAATRVSSTDQAPHRTGPDRTAEELVLNDTEQEAIELLKSTNRSISKRNIADAVRTELGRSIASDRAADIARHFRTLRSAA